MRYNSYELGTVCSRLSSGKNIPAKYVAEEGKYPVFGGNGLRGYTSTKNFEGSCAIIGRQGAFCGNVRFFCGEAYMTEHAVVVCADENNDTRYLSYLLSTMNLGRLSGQSAQPGLSVKTLAKQIVNLPSLECQKKVVAVLSALDDKIELNQRINDNLQWQLRTMFASTFTDNDEVDTMIQVPLADLCSSITKGTTPTTLGKSFVTEGVNFIKAESIQDSHVIDKSKFAYIDDETNMLLKRSIIQAGDIVFTIAGTLGRFALIDESILPANTNQAVSIIRADKSKVTPEYLYSFFMGNWHNNYYSKRIQQAVQANLSLTTIKSLPIPVLDKADMESYLQRIVPLISTMKETEKENEKLALIRDTLLPKLMSGEIDVSDIA